MDEMSSLYMWLLWRGMLSIEGKGDQSPYPTVFESTGPKDWPNPGQNEGQSYLHSMTYNRLDREGNAVAWPEEIEEKERTKWLAKPFSAKMTPFCQRKLEKTL